MGCGFRFDGDIEGAGLPSESAHGERGEFDKYSDDAYFETNKIGFRIFASGGEELVSGPYVGAENDRDWVLESVRIHTRNLEVDPVRIEYEDGSVWEYIPEWRIVASVQKSE
ncbi:MAG: hypothetical protein R3229_15075 [Alphaproteobacteria bacterium]|nr:hypothetical protein [Alphaproteobacteria bacterium]